MKEVGIAILIVVVMMVFFGGIALLIVYGNQPDNIGTSLTNGWYYALTAKVVETDEENDIVTCEDFNGNLWQFYGVEDWEVGDCASLLMNSKGTEKIFDDEIMGARFSAWTLTR